MSLVEDQENAAYDAILNSGLQGNYPQMMRLAEDVVAAIRRVTQTELSG